MKLYKFLNTGGRCIYGKGSWHLPIDGKSGKWMPSVKGDLAICENGYHLCREDDVLEWFGSEMYEAEYSGEILEGAGKVVVRRARLVRRIKGWNKRAARLFACECAEHVLHIFESEFPKDKGPRRAIEVARMFANGGATLADMSAAQAAAWAAPWDAAQAAARAAARAARDAAQAAAWDAARDAAWDASWAASWDASRDASRAAARGWQIKTFKRIVGI